MFTLEVTNLLGAKSRHYWMNASEDDFLRYLPKNFGVPKENIRAWMFSDDDLPILEGYIKALDKSGALDLSQDGKIKVLKITRTETPSQIEGEPPLVSESVEVLAEFSGDEVGWPYSDGWRMSQPELGKFLGFQKL